MKNWWRRLSKFTHLPLADQLLLMQTCIVVSIIQIGLKLLSFQQFRKVYSKVAETKKCQDTSDRLIERRVWAIQKVSGMLAAFCLPQALALTCFLRRDKGIELIVGVRKNYTFEAHAWVEKNGIILIGQLPDSNFHPLWIWR